MEYTLSVVKNIHMYVHVWELVDIVEHQLTEIYESFCRVAVQEFSPSLLNVPNYHESENITQLQELKLTGWLWVVEDWIELLPNFEF